MLLKSLGTQGMGVFIILAMISISRMKNAVYNLIGLEDSCICDHCLTECLSVEVTKDSFSMRLAQIYHKVREYCIQPKLNYSSTLRASATGFGKGCKCAKGIQDTESSISNDTLKPSANKEKIENFIQFSEVPAHVTLMNNFSETL